MHTDVFRKFKLSTILCFATQHNKNETFVVMAFYPYKLFFYSLSINLQKIITYSTFIFLGTVFILLQIYMYASPIRSILAVLDSPKGNVKNTNW